MSDLTVFVDLNAERSVLGSMLQDENAVRAGCTLNETDFHDGKHRAIFSAIQAVHESKKPVDLVTVDGWLTDHGLLDHAGGTGHIIEIAQYVPTTANVGAYIKLVREASLRRRIRAVCTATSESAGNGAQTALDVLDTHRLSVNVLLSDAQGSAVSVQGAIMRFNAEMVEPKTAHGVRKAYMGIPSLDAKVGGISGGKLVVVGARPGIGKSAFALAAALTTCKAGHRTLFISLEMDEVELMTRIVARYSGVPVDAIEGGKLTPEQITAVVGTYRKIDGNKIDFCHTARTIAGVRHEAYQAHAKGDLGLIVVDYIGLLRSGERSESRRVEVGQITRALKLLAGELKTPVLAVSQLNRTSEGGTDKYGRKLTRLPTMAELRESGDVEQDANIVMLLHRPEEGADAEEQMHIDDCKARGLDYVVVLVEKNRQGRRGVFPVAFDGAHMRYARLGDARSKSDNGP